MPYLWEIPDSYPASLIGDYDRSVSPDRFLLRKGEPVSIELGVPVIKFAASLSVLNKYACLPNSSMLPLVSEVFGRALMSLAPKNIQLLKAKIQVRDGETDSFSVLNVTTKIMAIDKAQSRFSYIRDTQFISSFERLEYLAECLGSHMIARDAEYLSHILVADELVATFKHMKISTAGAAFLRTSEMSW